MTIPTNRRYAESHEWALLEGDVVTVGISSFAVSHLNDLTHLELPEVGATFDREENIGFIESVKAVSELFSPVSGEVIEVNEDLAEDGVARLNADNAYDEWMIKVKISSPSEFEELKDAKAYEAQIAEEE